MPEQSLDLSSVTLKVRPFPPSTRVSLRKTAGSDARTVRRSSRVNKAIKTPTSRESGIVGPAEGNARGNIVGSEGGVNGVDAGATVGRNVEADINIDKAKPSTTPTAQSSQLNGYIGFSSRFYRALRSL